MSITVNTPSGSQLLSQLKWPVESIYCGMQPVFNVTPPVYSGNTLSSGNANFYRDWHNLTSLTNNVADQQARAGSLLATNNADPTVITPAIAYTQTSQWSSRRLTYTLVQKTLQVVSIVAHGIPIFNTFNAEFFSNYMPYHFGGYNVITPEDTGALAIHFCLYPGTYQPSGHMNISRAREFYFNYVSTFVNSSNVSNLKIVAIAINFLLNRYWKQK